MTKTKDKPTPPTDWRAERLNEIRALINQAAPEATEEQKWKKPSNPSGVPTWSDHGIICTGETYKDKVKLTFARGASLSDPHRLLNAGLDGKTHRAIDLTQSDILNKKAFLKLMQAAVALNRGNTDT